MKTIEKCVQYEYAARYDVTINIAQHFNSIFIWKKNLEKLLIISILQMGAIMGWVNFLFSSDVI